MKEVIGFGYLVVKGLCLLPPMLAYTPTGEFKNLVLFPSTVKLFYFFVSMHFCYILDLERLTEYHRWSFEAFMASLTASVPMVFCDNTNAQLLAPYPLCGNKHGASADTIQAMIDR